MLENIVIIICVILLSVAAAGVFYLENCGTKKEKETKADASEETEA